MSDYLARFQRKIAANAAAWLDFMQAHSDDPAALDRELANLTKAAQQALLEPLAWDEGLALLGETWRHVELRGQWQAWQGLLAQGIEVSREAGRAGFEAVLLDQLGEVARLLGDNRGAQEHFTTALGLYRTLADPAGAGRTLTHLSQAQLARGAWRAALQSALEAVTLLQDLDRPNDLAMAHNNCGLVYHEQGHLADALTHFDLAHTGFNATGNLRGQAKTLVNSAEVKRMQHQWDAAEQALRQALALYEQLSDPLHMAGLQMNLSILLHQRGQSAEALALSLEAEGVFRRLGHRPFLARVCNNLGIFLSALHRLAEARDAFVEATRLHLENEDRPYAASAMVNCAEVLIDQRRWTEAGEQLAQAQRLLDTLSVRPRWVTRDYETQLARLKTMTGAQPAT